MEVKFYKTSSDNAVLNKDLTNERIVNVTIRNESDVLSPVISIDISGIENFDVNSFNYLYIPRNERYYYLSPPIVKPHNVFEYNATIDVLMSWKDKIKNVTGTIDRQENVYNGYIPDNEYKALSYSQIVTKSFPNGMNNDSFILMTIG